MINIVSSQDPYINEEWNKILGSQLVNDGYSVFPMDDGNYTILGETSSSWEGGYDLLFMKVDKIGNIIKEASFGGHEDNSFECAEKSADSNFLVVCDYNLRLIKLDSSGNILWDKTLKNDLRVSHSIRSTKDGGFIITGRGSRYYPKYTQDLFLSKVDSEGNLEWEKYYGGPLGDDGFSVDETSDGGYIIVGQTQLNANSYSSWMIKTDSDGNKLWENSNSGCDYIEETSDGGFITTCFGLIKTDSLGNVIWTDSESLGEYVHEVHEVKNGYVAQGHNWLAIIDSNGKTLLNKSIIGPDGYISDIRSFNFANDGGLILTGHSYAQDGSNNKKVWLIKIGPIYDQKCNKIGDLNIEDLERDLGIVSGQHDCFFKDSFQLLILFLDDPKLHLYPDVPRVKLILYDRNAKTFSTDRQKAIDLYYMYYLKSYKEEITGYFNDMISGKNIPYQLTSSNNIQDLSTVIDGEVTWAHDTASLDTWQELYKNSFEPIVGWDILKADFDLYWAPALAIENAKFVDKLQAFTMATDIIELNYNVLQLLSLVSMAQSSVNDLGNIYYSQDLKHTALDSMVAMFDEAAGQPPEVQRDFFIKKVSDRDFIASASCLPNDCRTCDPIFPLGPTIDEYSRFYTSLADIRYNALNIRNWGIAHTGKYRFDDNKNLICNGGYRDGFTLTNLLYDKTEAWKPNDIIKEATYQDKVYAALTESWFFFARDALTKSKNAIENFDGLEDPKPSDYTNMVKELVYLFDWTEVGYVYKGIVCNQEENEDLKQSSLQSASSCSNDAEYIIGNSLLFSNVLSNSMVLIDANNLVCNDIWPMSFSGSWINSHLHSNADLHIYDPLGRHIGKNYITGNIDIEIPGATYISNDSQDIMIPELTVGTYRIVLVGISSGPYDLDIVCGKEKEILINESYSGTISRGEVYNASINATTIAGLNFEISSLKPQFPPNQPPIASFIYNQEYPGEPITFNASDSYDLDGLITKYIWDFGDGISGVGRIIDHPYSYPGNYKVRLTVIDDKNAIGLAEGLVNVMNFEAKIAVKKDADLISAAPGATVNFTIRVSNTGETTLNPIVAIDKLPYGLNYVSNNRSGYIIGRNLFWSNLGPLGKGRSTSIQLSCMIDKDASGTLENEVDAIGIVSSIDDIYVNANSSDNRTVSVVVPAIMVEKTLDLSEPVQYGQFCENQKVTGTGKVDISTSVVDKKLALLYQDSMAGDGDIELESENALSESASKLQRTLRNNATSLNLYENTKLTYSGETPLIGGKYLESKEFFGGIGASIQEAFYVNEMEKDQQTSFASTDPTSNEVDLNKIDQLRNASSTHLVALETKNTFNGTWGTDASWHKIFYKDINAHEMLRGHLRLIRQSSSTKIQCPKRNIMRAKG